MADLKSTLAGHAGTANTFLTSHANKLATSAGLRSTGTGFMSKIFGWAASGLTKFANFSVFGKAATIGVAAILGKNMLFGGSRSAQQPGQRYV